MAHLSAVPTLQLLDEKLDTFLSVLEKNTMNSIKKKQKELGSSLEMFHPEIYDY